MINELGSIGRSLASGRGYIPFMLVMLLFSLTLAFLILRPFSQPIILAIVLASLFHPVHVRLVRLYRGRQILAALTVIFLITFVIVIPMVLFLSALFAQGVESFNRIYGWFSAGNFEKILENPKIAVYMEWIRQNLPFIDTEKIDFQDNLMRLSKTLGQVLLSRGANLLGNITGVITNFFIMIFITFYFIKDGERLVERIKYLSPLPEDHEEQIFGKIKNVARSVAIYSIVLVGSIDNFLRPYFMKGQAEMSPFVIFLAIVGGIQMFGLIGILYGPLIISFAAVMLYIYSIEFKSFLDSTSIINSKEDE